VELPAGWRPVPHAQQIMQDQWPVLLWATRAPAQLRRQLLAA
jgi:hypothetical protein